MNVKLPVLAGLWLAAAAFAHAAGAQRPNVLLIVADDLCDALGCYGNQAVKTPNLDRFATRAVRFDHAYVQYPVCNPSRSSFLTGLRPDQTGVTDNETLLRDRRPDVVTWPQLLKEQGWHTAAFGKIFHLGGGRDAELRARFVDLPGSWHTAEQFEPGEAGKRRLAGRNLTDGALKWCTWAAADGGDDDQPDGLNARAAIARIEELGERPWFIGVGFHKPHDPFIAPQRYFDLYPPETLRLHVDPPGTTPAPSLAIPPAMAGVFAKFTDRERLEFLRAYYAGTSFMDAQAGRVFDALDRLKLWERTLVIFVGDNGYHLGQRGWWNKNTLFEHSCRVPLIIAAPGVQPGVARGLVELVDLFPTVAGFCNVDPPAGLVGHSLRPLLDDPSRPGKPAAFTMITRGPQQPGASIRTRRWRYTEWSDGAKELYDHDADPGETHNVIELHPEVAAGLHQRLADMRTRPMGSVPNNKH
jgi:uncharacterized sulfatase